MLQHLRAKVTTNGTSFEANRTCEQVHRLATNLLPVCTTYVQATGSQPRKSACGRIHPMRTFWRRTTLGRRPRRAFGVVALLVAAALAACSPSTSTKAGPTPASSLSVTAVQLAKGWTNVPSPSVGAEGRLSGVTALSATDAWSVGQYEGADSLQRTLIEHWDGSQWKFVPSQNPGTQYNILQSVAGASANDVWAVGYQSSASNVTQALIEHWNGSSWNTVPAPDLGKDSGQLNGVAALTASDAWAVGTSTTNGGANTPTSQHALVEHWNGSAW